MTEPTAPMALASSGQLDETVVRVGLNVQIEAPSRPLAKVASNAGLGVAVSPAPTFEGRR